KITLVHSTGLGQSDQSYSYDTNGHLGTENANSLIWSPRSNVTQLADGSTLSYDAANELVSRQAGPIETHYSFNDDGERTGATSPVDTQSYGWNGAGDLPSFTDNGTTTSYTVNGDGQRVSSLSGGVVPQLVWDATNPTAPPAAARVVHPWAKEVCDS